MTKRANKNLPTITLLRGGFGLQEIGVIVRTVSKEYTVGKQTLTGTRHIVQMNNARGAFSASVRFTWAKFENVEAIAA